MADVDKSKMTPEEQDADWDLHMHEIFAANLKLHQKEYNRAEYYGDWKDPDGNF